MKRLRIKLGHFFERIGRKLLRPHRLEVQENLKKELAVLTSSMDSLIKYRPESLEDVMVRSDASRTIQEAERVLAYLKERI